MIVAVSLSKLLHILVYVYWLGGDLGAFYASSFLISPTRSVPERVLAMQILNNLDMAPRTALILALPTGLTLAMVRGWLTIPVAPMALLWVFFLGWLALAWTVHRRHGAPAEPLRRVDLAIRYAVLAALLGAGIAGLMGRAPMPLFIAGKLLILAAAIGIGLLIRRRLVPLFAPFRAMVTTGPTPGTNTEIAGIIGRLRPLVVTLWILITGAAWLGTATPV